MTDLTINHNKNAQRFETTIDGTTGYLSYQDLGDRLVFDHTIVPQALGGQGVGSALVKHGLDFARDHHKKVVPQCSFVASYLQKHPEYQALKA